MLRQDTSAPAWVWVILGIVGSVLLARFTLVSSFQEVNVRSVTSEIRDSLEGVSASMNGPRPDPPPLPAGNIVEAQRQHLEALLKDPANLAPIPLARIGVPSSSSPDPITPEDDLRTRITSDDFESELAQMSRSTRLQLDTAFGNALFRAYVMASRYVAQDGDGYLVYSGAPDLFQQLSASFDERMERIETASFRGVKLRTVRPPEIAMAYRLYRYMYTIDNRTMTADRNDTPRDALAVLGTMFQLLDDPRALVYEDRAYRATIIFWQSLPLL